MSQTIFRVAYRHKPYSQIGNACLQDDRLSPEAGWVLVLMLSLPIDWRADLKWIASKRRMGRDRVRTAVKELQGLGYCHRRRLRNSNGKLGAYEYVFADEPGALSPAPEDQAVVPPAPEPPAPEDQGPYKGNTSDKGNTCRSSQSGINPPKQPVARSAKIDFQTTDQVALGEAGANLIPFDHVVDLKADTSAKRLPFTPKTIAEVRMMCVDPAELIERYQVEVAKGLKCRNPNGYLLRMARQVVERRDGVSEAHVKAMASKDLVKRAAFLAAEVEPIGPVKLARASSELVAQLARLDRARR